MDVLSVLRLLTRHWRVTAPAALLTVLLIGAAFRSSSPTYESTGSIVLLPPPEAPDLEATANPAPPPTVGQNPFARYGDLSVVADILARVLDSDSRQAEFESEGVTGYEVVANRLQRGPVVDVTGQGPTPEAAMRSTEIVLTEVNAVLSELQEAEGADPDYFIRVASVDLPSTATAMYGSTVRTAIAALAVGALGTLGLAVLAEVFARRRAARPTVVADPVMSDAASLGTDTGTSNGSRKTGWAGILPGPRLMRGAPAQQELGPKEPAQPERAQHEPGQQEPGQPEGSKQESARQEPGQPEGSKQESARQEPGQPEGSKQESARQEPGQPEGSKQESARRKTVQQDRSKQEAAWTGAQTFRQEPPSELLADNGHRRPTTDRSP
jgi:hypothetical protein